MDFTSHTDATANNQDSAAILNDLLTEPNPSVWQRHAKYLAEVRETDPDRYLALKHAAYTNARIYGKAFDALANGPKGRRTVQSEGTDQLSELGQAALHYALEMGWAVFPLVPNGKGAPHPTWRARYR